MGCVQSMTWNLNTWDVFWMKQVLMSQHVVGKREVESGRRVASAISLQLDCAKVLHELLFLVTVLYGIVVRQ